MSVPGTPTIETPSERAILNPLQTIVVRSSKFIPTTFGTTSSESQLPSGLQEALGGPQCWIDQGYLLSSDSTQAQMAHAEKVGVSNKVQFLGLTYAASVDAKVTAVELTCCSMMTWVDDDTTGVPGDAWVRYWIYHRGKRIAILDDRSNTHWTGGSDPIPGVTESIDLYRLIQARSATAQRRWYMSLTEVVQELNYVDVVVESFVGGNHNVIAWYVAPLGMKISFETSETDWQGDWRVQVATDDAFTTGPTGSLVYDSGIVIDLEENKRHFAILPGELRPGTLPESRFFRVQVKDQERGGVNWSDWSDVVEVTILSERAARMVNGDVQAIGLVEIDIGIWTEVAAWDKYEVSASFVYRFKLARTDMPVETWWLKDLSVDGVEQGYTIVETIDEVEATNGSIMYDEEYVYCHPREDVHPAFSGTARAGGCDVVVVLPLSTKAVVSGPYNNTPYLPVVLGDPSCSDLISSFRAGVASTPSGNLRLANVKMSGWDLQSTDPRARPLWWRLFALRTPYVDVTASAQRQGGMCSRRSVRMLMLPEGGRYAEAVRIFRGGISLDGATLRNEEINVKMYGWEISGKERKFGGRKMDRVQFPNAPETSVGTPMAHVFGAGHMRLKAVVVDTVNARLGGWENLSVVNDLYMDGGLYDADPTNTWSFDAATQTVSLTGPAGVAHATGSHTWEVDADGEEIDQFDASITAETRSGALFLRFLRELMTGNVVDSVPQGRYVIKDSFMALDDPDSVGSWPIELIEANVRCVFDKETNVLDAIRLLEDTRLAHVRNRADGYFDAVPMFPTELDATGVFVDRYDMSQMPQFTAETQDVGDVLVIEYMGYVDPHVPVTNFTRPDYDTFARLRLGGEVRITTMHAGLDGVEAVAAAWTLHAVRVAAPFQLQSKGIALPPGSTIVLSLRDQPADEMSDPGFSWGFWKVRKIDRRVSGFCGVDAVFMGVVPPGSRPDEASANTV